MEKIQVEVLGLSNNPASNGSYALILQEVEGTKRLPIVIGAFEAQAIALEMEGLKPARPFTHDLMKTIVEYLGSTLLEVQINDLQDGTFYAHLIFDNTSVEIDARPSDAIALALRFNAPIFVSFELLEEAGFDVDSHAPEKEVATEVGKKKLGAEKSQIANVPQTRLGQLMQDLDKAVKNEDYETAAILRDEISKLSTS